MTLIACLHPDRTRTLIADTLITSSNSRLDEIVLPLREYIPPEQIRAMERRPIALRRKLIEISPTLAALWSGDYAEARRFASRARAWFTGGMASEDDLLGFLEAHYREHVPNFQAILVPAHENWLYTLGSIYHSNSPFAGDYAAAGQGTKLFKNIVDRLAPAMGTSRSANLEGLRVTNECMTQEVLTAGPICSQFGGAYEVLYRTPQGFERVDDIFHFFVMATVHPTSVELLHYPHATRQWYEGEQLYVASLSAPEVSRQGVGFKGFAIRDVLAEEAKDPARPLKSLAMRPKYMCINHIFECQGMRITSLMTIWGDEIDRYFKLSVADETLTFEYMNPYRDLLLEGAEKARQAARQPPMAG